MRDVALPFRRAAAGGLSFASLSPCAGPRAEATFASSYLSWDGEERGAAALARSVDSPGRESAYKHGRFARLDEATAAATCAMRVALVTGRNEVADRVVRRVEVDVVSDQSTGRESAFPIDWTSAPVAGMGAGADQVVEHEAADCDYAARGCDRMSVRLLHAVVDDSDTAWSSGLVVAGERAEPAHTRGGLRHEWCAALRAGALSVHLPTIAQKGVY